MIIKILGFKVLLIFFLWQNVSAQMSNEIHSFELNEYHDGTSVVLYKDYVVFIGGEEESNQNYSNQVHFYKRVNQSFSKTTDFTLPVSITSLNAVSDESFIYLIGGKTQDGFNNRVFRIESIDNQISTEELSRIPVDTLYTNTLLFNGKLWTGGRKGNQSGYWTYEIDQGLEGGWEFEITTEFRGNTRITSQADGNGIQLIQISSDLSAQQYTISYLEQDSFETAYSFDVEHRILTDAFPIGFSGVILFFKNDILSEITDVYQLNTLTKKVSPFNFPFDLNVLELKKSDSDFVVVHQNNQKYYLSFYAPTQAAGIRTIDAFILLLYFALLIGMGYYFSKRNKSIDDYFRGGKRTPGWAAGLSIVATTLSAVSYMSLPGVSFVTNLTYIFMPFGNLVALVFVIYWVLPFYIRLNITSAYEYLELRFDTHVRLVGSLIYIVGVLFRLGVIILLPAIIVSVVTGMNIFLCIVLMGIISTIYTTLGGIEAVIWSDVLQVLVLIVGILFGITTILYQLNFDLSYVVETASGFEKLKFIDTEVDFSKVTIWVLILYSFGRINVFLSNQAIIQRLVSASSEREAAKSMVYNAVIGIPLFILLLVFGVLLFVFFYSFPENLSPFLTSQDQIVPTFVVNELPLGLSGMLIAAIFAAAMSTLDSTINSTSTVITQDLYIKYDWNFLGWSSFKFAKYMTGFLGVLGTLIALQLATFEISSIFDVFIEIIGIFGGGLAGIFLIGITTTRGNSFGAWMGIIASAIIIFFVKSYTDIHFFLYAIIGLSTSYGFGYLGSLFLQTEGQNLSGLTIFTLKK